MTDIPQCDFHIHTKYLGCANGTMEVSSIGGGSQWAVDFDITVSLLLVGGKLEGVIKDQTTAQFMQEKSFNDRWLVTQA